MRRISDYEGRKDANEWNKRMKRLIRQDKEAKGAKDWEEWQKNSIEIIEHMKNKDDVEIDSVILETERL